VDGIGSVTIWTAAVLGAAAAVAVVSAGMIVRVRQRWLVVRVIGASMMPTLRHGDKLLVRRCRATALRVGDIVVFERSSTGEPYANQRAVKRVGAMPGDPIPASVAGAVRGTATVPTGTLVVLSDHDVGVDSRTFGLLPSEKVLGVFVRVLDAGPDQTSSDWQAAIDGSTGSRSS
jgi:signal peptidase I